IVLIGPSDVSPNTFAETTAGGPPMTHFEYRTLGWQAVANHVMNLMAEGVFEKFPSLRVVVTGVGAAWLGGWMWRMEHKGHVHQSELPWMTLTPLEYFQRFIRVTTYPLNTREPDETLVRLLKTAPGIEEMLCFASGYPNW